MPPELRSGIIGPEKEDAKKKEQTDKVYDVLLTLMSFAACIYFGTFKHHRLAVYDLTVASLQEFCFLKGLFKSNTFSCC